MKGDGESIQAKRGAFWLFVSIFEIASNEKLIRRVTGFLVSGTMDCNTEAVPRSI